MVGPGLCCRSQALPVTSGAGLHATLDPSSGLGSSVVIVLDQRRHRAYLIDSAQFDARSMYLSAVEASYRVWVGMSYPIDKPVAALKSRTTVS